jgi:GT2 family glycosyltransferase
MPDVSVVIASVNGLPEIDECLSALERQKGGVDFEVVVANRRQDGTAEHISRRFPGVKLLQFPGHFGIPQLRAMAMAEAKGDIIVVTEDHCIAPENWLAEIVKAHQLGYMVVGGAVENGKTDRIIDWSVFLCEYSSAMLPITAGEVNSIPGNNAAYKKAALDLVDDGIKKNFWESFLHDELRKKGIKLLSVPSIVVTHKKEFRFFYFLSQRFHYSRSFAGMRRSQIPQAKRLYYLLGSPLLPFLMAIRVAQNVIVQKKRFYKEFFLSLPSLSVFFISYAMGEFIGYLLGPGGSLSKVE